MKLVEVQFFVRTNERNPDYKHVYYHISVDGQRTKSPLSAGIKIHKDLWNSEIDRLHDRFCPENKELAEIEAEIKMQATILRTKGINFSAETLKNALFKEEKFVSFFDLIEKFISYKFDKEDLKPSTKRTILDRKNNVVKFLETYNYKNLACEDFKPKTVDELQTFLRKNLVSCCDAHIRRHLQLVNSVINYAVLYEYADKNPLQYYRLPKVGKGQKVVYLTQLEQSLLEAAIFTDKKLEQVRDIFVFASCLGLASIDRICFDFEKHTYLKDDNSRWFSMQRNKSKVYAEMPFPNKALEIIRKYNFKLPRVADNQNIEVENQMTNRYLKIIKEILGFKKHITTHTARKTACSNWLRAGVNENVIAAMMGWTSTKMLRTYSEVENEMIAKEVKLKFGV